MTVPTEEHSAAVPRARTGARAAPPAPRKKRAFKSKTPYLLVLPAVVLELLIHILPSLAGIWTSVLQLDQAHIRQWLTAPFVGFKNFTFSLNFSSSVGSSLVHSFLTTLLYTVIVVFFAWLFGMCAALVVQQRFIGRGVIRTVFLIPYAMPVYAGIIVWSFMLQRDNGLVNHVLVNDLHLFGSNQFWLLGNQAFVSAAVVAIWRSWPFAFLMLMAGMQSIPDETYEAASLDGAGSWKRIWYITMGMLRPISGVLLLMLFLWTFNDFNTPFVLFGGAPPPSMDLISIHIYNSSFIDYNFGLGAAMSVLMLVFLLIVTGFWSLLERRQDRAA